MSQMPCVTSSSPPVHRPLPGSIRLATRQTRAVCRIPEHSVLTWRHAESPTLMLPFRLIRLIWRFSQSLRDPSVRLLQWTWTGAVVSKCTTALTVKTSSFCSHGVFMCFIWFSQYTTNIYLNIINPLAFIMKAQCNFCEEELDFLCYSDERQAWKG